MRHLPHKGAQVMTPRATLNGREGREGRDLRDAREESADADGASFRGFLEPPVLFYFIFLHRRDVSACIIGFVFARSHLFVFFSRARTALVPTVRYLPGHHLRDRTTRGT